MAVLSDIIKEMGNNVNVQFLTECSVDIKNKKKTQDTEITFATNEVDCNTFLNGDKVGMVIWFSREDYNSAVTKLNYKD